MPASSTISSKGQITVPLEIRDRLGLKAGDRVEFVVDRGQTVLRPSHSLKNPFEKYIGSLPAFQNERQINTWIASLREDDDEG
jgi:AbrB family looped-hinge helix DNA binding protein